MAPDTPASAALEEIPERLGFIVVTYGRYGGKPWVGFLHDTLDGARAARDESARVSTTAKRDERHVVAEVFEVEEEKSVRAQLSEDGEHG